MSKTSRPRLLQIAHNHPTFHPGGTEIVALSLHRQALLEGYDSWFLGAVDNSQTKPHSGTQMIAMTEDHREAVLHSSGFHRLSLVQKDTYGFLREFADYLRDLRPDVVHFHHILQFGLDAVHVLRRVLPDALVLMTVHDFYLICANNGQMYRHHEERRCDGPSQIECLACCKDLQPHALALRDLSVAQTLPLIDILVAPSQLMARRVEALVGGKRNAEFIENGYLGPDLRANPPQAPRQGRNFVFGYFGNVSWIKGLGDLLAAAEIILQRGFDNFEIHVNGTQLYEDPRMDAALKRGSSALGKRLVTMGRYGQEDLADRMGAVDCVVFPSIWWENAPLVVYEALHHGRQVACYPHSGGQEILARHGTGFIATRSDPAALADAMIRAMEEEPRCGHAVTVPGAAELFAQHLRLYSIRRQDFSTSRISSS